MQRFHPPVNEKRKGTGRKRNGQDGHPCASRNLLPTEQCADSIPHFPTTFRGCGEALSGDDPEPHRFLSIDTRFWTRTSFHRRLKPPKTGPCAVPQEADGRWFVEVPELPGVLSYGDTGADAMSKAEILALHVIADRIEDSECEPVSISFSKKK